ncbi:hypothetical protein R6Q59_035636 [Mikania micrantha]
MQEDKNSKWTNEQNTLFESALAIFDTETPDRWSNVASLVPGKSETDVKKQYERLKADINKIEAGFVDPDNPDSSCFKLESFQDHEFRKRPTKFTSFDHERRKGIPWTEEEHRRFLMGLQVHGKGDWRSISRNYVMTKTPTQVASHAQKYYARQHADGKDKRRPSIHDITMVNLPHDPTSSFEIAKINKNGGNGINIRVFNSRLHFQPTTYQVRS